MQIVKIQFQNLCRKQFFHYDRYVRESKNATLEVMSPLNFFNQFVSIHIIFYALYSIFKNGITFQAT